MTDQVAYGPGIDPDDWGTLATGKSGWIEIERAWLRKAQETYNVFCEKQNDYGPTNIAVGGEEGLGIRLGDKISRIFELKGIGVGKKTKEPSNESIRDTWMDIADYGLIALTVHDGDWPITTPNQVWGKEAMVDLVMDMVRRDPELLDTLVSRLIALGLAQELADDIGAIIETA